jgi:endonuclease YncB( thermonuclease family)
MVWTGLLVGLLIIQALRIWQAPVAVVGASAFRPGAIDAPNPYAESERSRAILQAQEAPPVPVGAIEDSQIAGTVRVIDGDTFDFDGMRVRIADIDTPEVNGRCPYETELAARATRRAAALLNAGPFQLHPLASGRDEDRYGRKLRIVTRGGQSLGDVLVAEGLARTWTGRREPWCV